MVFNLKWKHVSYVRLKASQNDYDPALIKLIIHLTSSAHLYVIDYKNKVSDMNGGYRGYVPMKWMFQFFSRPIETAEIEFERFLKDLKPVEGSRNIFKIDFGFGGATFHQIEPKVNSVIITSSGSVAFQFKYSLNSHCYNVWAIVLG